MMASVTYAQLGPNGRLGNQLFQLSATIGYSVKYNVPCQFPSWKYQQFFNVPSEMFGSSSSNKTLDESAFCYEEIPLHEGALNLHGYRQSERYFEHCKDLIRQYLTPRDMPVSDELCSIHVRRTDYLKCPTHHPVLTDEWYKQAMQLFPSDQKFRVYSDDLPWCHKTFTDPRVSIAGVGDEMEHFKLMVSHRHHIIANSSFSWWTAWLSNQPDKRVIAPAKWFGPAYDCHNVKDLIPDAWTKI